jgi:hypothetical protein
MIVKIDKKISDSPSENSNINKAIYNKEVNTN